MKEIPRDSLVKMLFQMKRIRAYEEAIASRYPEQKMRCPTHLSIGQEAVPAAVSCALEKTDLAVSTHRSHAHYLGKGGDGKKMIAEIYGKATGCAAGRGGSMHLVDLDCGFKGSTAIVGNSIPVGVGLALSLKLQKTQNIAAIFLGDAAVEEGVFYESANFAALKQLPVLFLCENNLYSVYSSLKVRQPEGRQIFEMAAGIGLRSTQVDGNDVVRSYQIIRESVGRIREHGGPEFIEFSTYRWREHCGPNFDNHIGYRTEAEFQEWKLQDPILRHERSLLNSKMIDTAEIEKMDRDISKEVDEAFRFAEASPYPNPSEAFQFMYKEAL